MCDYCFLSVLLTCNSASLTPNMRRHGLGLNDSVYIPLTTLGFKSVALVAILNISTLTWESGSLRCTRSIAQHCRLGQSGSFMVTYL